jgi:hypothetical protein
VAPQANRPGPEAGPGEDRLDRLLAERGDHLLHAAIALTGSRPDAGDLLQAAVERVLRRRRRVDDLEAYLRRTLYNLAADGWRRRGAWHRLRVQAPSRLNEITGPDPVTTVDLRDALMRALRERPAAGADDRLRRGAHRTGPGRGRAGKPHRAGHRDAAPLDRLERGVRFGGTDRAARKRAPPQLAEDRPDHYLVLPRADQDSGIRPGGRLATDLGPSGPTRPGGPQPPARIIAVDPNAARWYRPLHNPPFFHPGRLTCTNQGVDWLSADGGGRSPAQLTTLISKALSCDLFRAGGHQVVDGADALRLAATPRLLRQLHGEAWDVGPGVTLWVNAKTFLPVRLVLGPVEHADIGWLKPTAANLATLRVTVPAGLHEVRLPAGATIAWAAGTVRNR